MPILFKIASAMMERAEFPVQRKRTLNFLAMAYLPSICVTIGNSPNHAGCFMIAVAPIAASSRQITLICSKKEPTSPPQHRSNMTRLT